ncbi:uncharacterized protein AMSG_02712 [Thecamonas trahens ATCC 50062]|uniref:Uncharacterized protein n=1 Tax=Thecamonas trahens ATCC 50062 TaxID=461836 RepID=A0A0L0D4M8_THETB|nr:hypothetical protein AMSG_02712 [Thecamonas trahens ATCC 50062]KNC46258.1 hypothetical protein AMSG_02712 [Thecamonas trahens ATCC 50062]|eukprot:XP_013760552.1 hypothetical protein AMSG_02712 [Thecamonas trahens ATCC 50062]
MGAQIADAQLGALVATMAPLSLSGLNPFLHPSAAPPFAAALAGVSADLPPIEAVSGGASSRLSPHLVPAAEALAPLVRDSLLTPHPSAVHLRASAVQLLAWIAAAGARPRAVAAAGLNTPLYLTLLSMVGAADEPLPDAELALVAALLDAPLDAAERDALAAVAAADAGALAARILLSVESGNATESITTATALIAAAGLSNCGGVLGDAIGSLNLPQVTLASALAHPSPRVAASALYLVLSHCLESPLGASLLASPEDLAAALALALELASRAHLVVPGVTSLVAKAPDIVAAAVDSHDFRARLCALVTDLVNVPSSAALLVVLAGPAEAAVVQVLGEVDTSAALERALAAATTPVDALPLLDLCALALGSHCATGTKILGSVLSMPARLRASHDAVCRSVSALALAALRDPILATLVEPPVADLVTAVEAALSARAPTAAVAILQVLDVLAGDCGDASAAAALATLTSTSSTELIRALLVTATASPTVELGAFALSLSVSLLTAPSSAQLQAAGFASVARAAHTANRSEKTARLAAKAEAQAVGRVRIQLDALRAAVCLASSGHGTGVVIPDSRTVAESSAELRAMYDELVGAREHALSQVMGIAEAETNTLASELAATKTFLGELAAAEEAARNDATAAAHRAASLEAEIKAMTENHDTALASLNELSLRMDNAAALRAHVGEITRQLAQARCDADEARAAIEHHKDAARDAVVRMAKTRKLYDELTVMHAELSASAEAAITAAETERGHRTDAEHQVTLLTAEIEARTSQLANVRGELAAARDELVARGEELNGWRHRYDTLRADHDVLRSLVDSVAALTAPSSPDDESRRRK